MNTEILHILNGDGTLEPFSESGLPGKVLVWREMLCDGPSASFETAEELTQIRGTYLEEHFGGTKETYNKLVVEVWQQLPQRREGLEVVLWFEHDLFCQVNLVYLTQLLFHRGFKSVSVVSPDHHPEVPGFRGMGQLQPQHFPPLFKARRLLQTADLELADRVWDAWTSPTPEALQKIDLNQQAGWPHLAAAMQLHGQLFPSVETGLNQVETWLLHQLSTAPQSKGQLFRAFCEAWDRLGWGDLQFFNAVNRLKGLLEENESGFTLSPTGKQVLDGKRNRFQVLPHPVRIANVVCTGKQAEWRWSNARKALVFHNPLQP